MMVMKQVPLHTVVHWALGMRRLPMTTLFNPLLGRLIVIPAIVVPQVFVRVQPALSESLLHLGLIGRLIIN
jgi:hypothetical protein